VDESTALKPPIMKKRISQIIAASEDKYEL
jgi:hypothetical protein